jgi:hypothetical protein
LAGEVSGMEYRRMVHCYAEGRPGHWEAFCIDFDIAVQGSSLDEVRAKLHDAIELYINSVFDLPNAEDRARLLNRQAPWVFRLRVWLKMLASLSNRSADREQRAVYDCPLNGAVLAA